MCALETDHTECWEESGFQESNRGGGGAREKVTAAVQVSNDGGMGLGGGRGNGEKHQMNFKQDWKAM